MTSTFQTLGNSSLYIEHQLYAIISSPCISISKCLVESSFSCGCFLNLCIWNIKSLLIQEAEIVFFWDYHFSSNSSSFIIRNVPRRVTGIFLLQFQPVRTLAVLAFRKSTLGNLTFSINDILLPTVTSWSMMLQVPYHIGLAASKNCFS